MTSLALLALLASTTAPSGQSAAERAAVGEAPARYVVVVGYNGPADGERPPLSWADDDAARLYRQLLPGARRAWLLTTFDTESARMWGPLVDVAAPPTRQELARVLGEAYWAMREEARDGPAGEHGGQHGAELVFAFAGHGDVSPGGEGYALLADGPFLRSDLERQVIAASPATTNHIIIDACAAYFLVARGGDRSVPVAELVEELARRPSAAAPDAAAWARTGILVATSDAAEVHESAALGGGVFSYLLRSALAGAADANGDGRVEYGEVAAFVAAASAAVKDPRARLAIHTKPPAQTPHVALMDLETSGLRHFLVVDQRGPVRLRLLDARGLPYAEVHREENGPPVVLALASDPFYVVERGEQEAVLVPRSAGAYALSSLRFGKAATSRSPDPRTAQLFALPYGPGFLGGYLARGEQLPPADGESFQIAWAEAGAPDDTPPWGTLAVGTLGAAGVLAVTTGVALAGNALSLADLERRFRETGTLDPALALQADGWLTAAAVLGAATAASTALAGGFYLLSLQEEP